MAILQRYLLLCSARTQIHAILLLWISFTQNSISIVASIPRKCLGDGLAYDKNRDALYLASEGDFLLLTAVYIR